MLCSVLPWEWILESVLDLKEFSLPCLKELIREIPHIEDPRCSKLLQKVALRYLEEIVLTRKVDTSAITLIKYILKAQGVSNLRRIHSLKESVENDLVLRVETEVVLATIRHQGRNGSRNWEAFQNAVEEVFVDSVRGTCNAERRKELISILSDDMCEKVLRKYPLEDLLKDLLQFIDSKKKLLKTKFLDQLAKDVHSGSYVPSSASRASDDELSSPARVSKDCHGNPEVPGNVFARDKTVLSYSSQMEPSLPKILLGEPIERITKGFGQSLADLHTGRSSPSFPVDDRRTPRLEVEELADRNPAGKKCTTVDKVSVQEDLRVDMSMSMMEVDKVARELRSQMNDFVDDMDKFAADIHKVAVDSTEQDYNLVSTVVAQKEQRVDPISFLANFDKAVKRTAADQLPESAKKSIRGCLDDSPGRGTDADGEFPAKAGLSSSLNNDGGQSTRKDDRNIELDCCVPGDEQNFPVETSLYRRFFKAFVRESAQEQLGPSCSASTVHALERVSCGHDTGCALCKKEGVLLSCRGCSVVVHEHCLEEVDFGKPIDEPYWFCPSCVEQLTLKVLERVKAEADTARQKAAAFMLARSKQSTERRRSAESADGLAQMTNSTGAIFGPEENTNWKDGKKQDPGMKHGLTSSSLDDKGASQEREMNGLDGTSLPKSKSTGKRYCLRPRVLAKSRRESEFCVDKVSLPRSKADATTGVDGRKQMLSSSATVAGSSPSKTMSEMITPENVQSVPGVEEIPETSIPSKEGEENSGQTNFKSLNRSDERQDTANAGSSGCKHYASGSGNLSPAKDPQVNNSKAGVDEGDGHDGGVQEDISRHQDDAECSEGDHSSEHPTPLDQRTPSRRGRYRGRWKIPGVRRKNLPWTESEVTVLREGVQKFSGSGWGFQWKNILELGYGKFDPSRTSVDLKDKWRNLNKFQDRSSSSDDQ